MTPLHRSCIGLAAALAALLLGAAPARAELVFFASGRSLSVKGHRVEGDSLILALRSGGEIECEAKVILRIEPDEVPYPDPAAEEPPAPVPPRPTPPGAGPYAEMIDRLAEEQGVDPRLVRAVIQVESGFRERARSPKGAMGLMQLMPETARQYAVRDPYDPRANIEAGIKYLKSLLARFTPALALAAYNAGEAEVQRFGGVPPYPETRDYVARVLQLVAP